MPEDYLPYIVIAVVAIALIALTIVVARLAWRRQVRRYIVGLVGRREAIGAALKTADAVIDQLAAGSDEDLMAFIESGSEERRALAEVAERMRLETTELADIALPKSLWELADDLGRASAALAEQTGRVGDAAGEGVLDALVSLDLSDSRDALSAADVALAGVSETYDLTDSAVYGGGLYI